MTVIVVDFTKSKKCKEHEARGKVFQLRCDRKYPFSVDIYTDEMNKYPFDAFGPCSDSACNAALNLIHEIKLSNVRCIAVYQGSLEQRSINDEALKLYFPLRKTNNTSGVLNERPNRFV